MVDSSLERLKTSHGVQVTWHAFELRPKGSPPISDDYRTYIESQRPRLEAVAREHFGLNINPGPFGIDSRPAMIGAKYAAEQGKGYVYNQAMLRAYWQAGQDISQLTVIQDVAEHVGLDGEQFTAALENPKYEAEVDADIAQARAYGITGVPALLFVNKYLVVGAQPYGELVRILEQIQEHEAKHDN